MDLRQKREKEGITCKRCGGVKHYWINSLLRWECASCKACISLKSGTIMEDSKMPLHTWYMVIHLMTSTKKNISALEVQKQVGWKRYEPIWAMMHKIRTAMGNRDALYQLNNAIEADDAFFNIVDLERDKTEAQKRGRGSQKQASVLIMVESTLNPEPEKPYKKNRIMGYAKMLVMKDLKSEGIEQEVELALNPNSNVITDGFSGFNGIKDLVVEHNAEVTPPKEAS